jgi:hypothetical protein
VNFGDGSRRPRENANLVDRKVQVEELAEDAPTEPLDGLPARLDSDALGISAGKLEDRSSIRVLCGSGDSIGPPGFTSASRHLTGLLFSIPSYFGTKRLSTLRATFQRGGSEF